ncbi:ComEC/Rec2 family competence protein [Croceiramulus getboli]|nr:ComEC/Rec2 family competence protein [Flavobacteriaceae bacterium YJPT1-3]
MKGINIPLLWCTLMLALGIIAAHYFPMPFSRFWMLGLGSFVIFGVVYILVRKLKSLRIYFTLSCALLLAFLGYGRSLSTQPKNQDNHYWHHLEPGKIQQVQFRILEERNSTSYAQQFTASLLSINGQSTLGRVLLQLRTGDNSIKKLVPDQGYLALGTFQPIPASKNPYQFDYGNFLANQKIYGQIILEEQDLVALGSLSPSWRGWAFRFRESVKKELLALHYEPLEYAVINALLLGERQHLPKVLREDYAAAGLIHILALSGLHIGILLLITSGILKVILSAKRYSLLRLLLTLLIISSFACIAGLSASLLRAATMFSFVAIGMSKGRQQAGYNALIISALILLWINPKMLFEVGFQLSYAAVFSILWIYPLIQRCYTARFKLDRLLWNTFSVSLSAQLGVLPLSLFYFHQFPGLFWLANLVVVPFLGIILGTGILLIGLALLNALPAFYADAYGNLIGLLNAFTQWIAEQEMFLVEHIYFTFFLLLTSYGVLITGVRFFKKPGIDRFLILTFGLLIFLGILLIEIQPKPDALVILHQNRKSLILMNRKNSLNIYTSDSITHPMKLGPISDWVENRFTSQVTLQNWCNYFEIDDRKILLIDRSGVYDLNLPKMDYVVITQAPRIHFDRLVNTFPDAVFIADGSNYKRDVLRWQQTCRKKEIPFHNTYEKGAYIIESAAD